jgi:hypothetical protein
MVLQDNKAEVEAQFSPLEIVLILTQDRFVICNEHITGSDILLDAPDGSRGCRGSYGITFRSIWR